MKKEKFSYLVLVLEIVAIVYLHSVKKSSDSDQSPEHIVQDPAPKFNTPESSPYMIHQVKQTTDHKISF